MLFWGAGNGKEPARCCSGGRGHGGGRRAWARVSVTQSRYSSGVQPAAGHEAVVVGLRAHGPEDVRGAVGVHPGAQLPEVGEQGREPAHPVESLRGVPLAQLHEGRVRGGGLVEHPQQRPDPPPQAGLGVGVGLQPAVRVRRLDDAADPGALVDGHLGPVGATGQRGLYGGGEQAGLARGRAVDRLHGDPGLGGDPRDRRTGVAALQEDPRGGLDDRRPGAGGLLAAPCRVVAAAGSCVLRH